jgi:prepilin-type N-terminal cleavage/methylation domain-containing protein
VLSGRRPPGFSLVELIVTVALLGVVSLIISALIIQQQRVLIGSVEIMETRGSLRQLVDILPGELRAVSPSRGDIYSVDAAFLEFRAPVGSAVVCDIDSTRTRITIPPRSTAARNGTAAWLQEPRAGDSLLIYDEGPTRSAGDDSWRAHALAAPPTPGTCALFTSSAAEAALGATLVLSAALEAGVHPGASVRFFRRARYELYDAADGLGYLGFSDCLPTRSPPCSVRQPVSGPYLRRAGPLPGLVLSYFDSAGATVADPRRVARIDVLSRSRSRGAMAMPGYPRGHYIDSLSFSIAVRN